MLGMYIGMSVLQGGPGLPVFSKHLYDYITNGEYLNLNIEISDVPEPGVRILLQKVGMGHDIIVKDKYFTSNRSLVQHLMKN